MSIFKKKLNTENAAYNEDNVVKFKSKGLTKSGIKVKSAMLVVNFITFLVSIAAIVAIVYGGYYVLHDIVGLDFGDLPFDFDGSSAQETEVNADENSIARETLPIFG